MRALRARHLQAHPLLQDASEQGAADLNSTYFDTAEQCLREDGLGLWVRRIGDRYIQTLMDRRLGHHAHAA